jgi:DNA modification methylase
LPVPVIRLEGLTDQQKRALVIADNKLAINAAWDETLLAGELRSLGELEGLVGFSADELMRLMAPAEPLPDPEIPQLPANPVTRAGDIWQCGAHRIICGDCRDRYVMDRLMAGTRINIAFTSPPYAEQRNYDASSSFRPIPPDEYVAWFAPVAANVAAQLVDDGSWFVNIKPSAAGLDTELYVLDLVLAHVRQWGWHFATEFCWERVGVPKAVTQRFKNQFEPVYQFARNRWKMRPDAVRHQSDNVPTAGGAGSGQTSWKDHQGGNAGGIAASFGAAKKRRRGFPSDERNQGTAWQRGAPLGVPQDLIGAGLAYPGNRLPTFAASHEATGHAAAFPVGLPEFFCKAFSDPGDAVLDPFLGSGSSLIAADRSGRVGYGCEISPAYCDVAVTRWENFTGRKAERISRAVAA